MKNKKRTIFIDASGITNSVSGLGNYSFFLLEKLLTSDEYEFVVLCDSDLHKNHKIFNFQDDRIKIITRPVPVIGPKRDFLYFLKLKEDVNKCSLYHCLASYLPVFGIQIPSVVTVHDLKYIKHPEFLSNQFKSIYLKYSMFHSFRKSTEIIAISEHTKKDLIESGIAAKKITVIYEACTLNPGRKGSSANPIGHVGEPYLFFLGVNRPHKNLKRTILAYRQLHHSKGNLVPRLVIAGKDTQSLAPFVSENGLDGKVDLRGTVDDRDLRSLYENAQGFLYPSLYEGFGLPILESMAAGTPVLTSLTTATREIAADAAILVDPYSVDDICRGIFKMVFDGGAREEYVKKGFKRLESFSWETTAKKTLCVYDSLLRVRS